MYHCRELDRVELPAGDIRKFIKLSDAEYKGFGEIYFSHANNGYIKAWKKHTKMTMNIVTIIGKVRFVFSTNESFDEVILDSSSNTLLTVYPGVWFGFQGIEKENLICNFANIEHSEKELERKDISEFDYDWSKT